MFGRKRKAWDDEADVVVVGSGGAGLTAAILAHDEGASVRLLEKSPYVGGTTAVSGGVVWVPLNHKLEGSGVSDTRDEALSYIKRVADGRSEDRLIECYVDTARDMARYLDEHTPLTLEPVERYPDYHPEFDGGKPGARSMESGLFDTNTLGEWNDKLRRSPIFGATPMSVKEATDWGVFSNPLNIPYKELAERFSNGMVCYGASLVGHLLRGLLDRNLEPILGVRVLALEIDDGIVCGVRVERNGNQERIRARKGVILATGGFEWDAALNQRFLGGVLTHPNSPPINEGDGLRMAMAAGADLGNMTEAWWCPSIVVPGETSDDVQLNRGDFAIRSLPHSIIVNRAGRRFVNEAQNYNDLMKPFFHFDPNGYERPNLPAHLVLDQQFADKYLLVTSVPGTPVPDWITRADTLEELAQAIEVDPRGLVETVRRFNDFAQSGRDKEFSRGESLYDQFYGDPTQTPNPNLGPIHTPPFYSIEVHPGAIGTKGGPRTDVHGRVLDTNDQPIPGLYAAGNVMAGVMGAGYPGAGATIGVAMTWGYLAGRHAASREC